MAESGRAYPAGKPEPSQLPARIWRALTEPSAAIQDPVRRRRARSLSIFLVASLCLAILAGVLTLLPMSPLSAEERQLLVWLELVSFVLLAAVYRVSRTSHSRWAAALTIGIFLVSTLIAALREPYAPAILTYTILGGLVSSLFLSPRATAAVFIVTCLGLEVLYFPLNLFSAHDVSRAVFLALIVAVLVVVGTLIREQDLQQIEQQSDALAVRETRLVVALESTSETNRKLQDSMRALEQSNREMALVAELGDLLQACETVAESYRVIGNVAPMLFPAFSGMLYAYGASRDSLEAVVRWGSSLSVVDERAFAPDQCWALRLGRPHPTDGLCTSTPCALMPAAANGLCVPLVVQGEAIGVLHLRSNPSSQDAGQMHRPNAQLAGMAGEDIGLAIANLRLRENLRLQSIRDPLTNLFNRRFMEETLEREIKRAERSRRPLSLIMLDLDHFKQFNDTFGHEAGDTLLRHLGDFLQANTRGGDIACRFGGEEFVVVLPETALKDGHLRAETIGHGIQELTVAYDGQSLGTITASLGVAVFPANGASVQALLRAADRALYRAKFEGRDRAVSATQPLDST